MEFGVDIKKANSCVNQLSTLKGSSQREISKLSSISKELRKTDDTAIKILSVKLEAQIQSIETVTRKINILQEGLKRILDTYDSTEEKIASYVSIHSSFFNNLQTVIPVIGTTCPGSVGLPNPTFDPGLFEF